MSVNVAVPAFSIMNVCESGSFTVGSEVMPSVEECPVSLHRRKPAGGSLSGVPDGGTVDVQFDANGDGIADGSIQAGGNTPFIYTPGDLTPGLVTIRARAHLVDAVLGDLYTAWTPVSFTLETGTNAKPVVTSLALQTVTVPTATTPTSSDSTLVGSVLNDGNVSYMTVQVDTNGDGQEDDSVTTDASGKFVYAPQTLSPGTYTYQFRAIENDYPDGQIVGDWSAFTFTVVAPAAPVVDQLVLANATGPGSTTTTDPTLLGHVTADGHPQNVQVDFDYNGDGVPDASTTPNSDGTFTFTPAGMQLGLLTIRARAVNLDDDITGNWTTITFTLAATQAPSVSSLTLLHDTGASATDNITDDPTVTGTLSGGVGVDYVTVQFDVNGDGAPDGSAVSDAEGNFTFTPQGVQPGAVTISARAVTTDPTTGAALIGDWHAFSFTLDLGAGPTVSTAALVNPTGTDSTTGLATAVDSTISGTLFNGSGLTAFLTVEYDTNGDGTPDGTTMTNAKGQFSFLPIGLSPGTNTVRIRGVDKDAQTGDDIDGAWTSVTFVLQQDTNGQAPTPPAITDNLTSGDQVAATSHLGNEQAVDDALQAFNADMGVSGATGQIVLPIGVYAAFAGDRSGRVASGSIYEFQNGSVPAPAGDYTGSGSGNGSSLPGSAPVGVPSGTSLMISANLATPRAASGSVTNQSFGGNGTLGPGSSNAHGALNGLWSIQVIPPGGGGNVTSWSIDIQISTSYSNVLSGFFSNTAGAIGSTQSYTDAVSGSYNFHLLAWGTSTVTASGTIIAGTFQIDESSSYNFDFSNTITVINATPGAASSGTTSSTASGSDGFTHHELGGSFGSGTNLGYGYDLMYGAGVGYGGLLGGSFVHSDFSNRTWESYSFANHQSGGYNDSSVTGTDVGATSHDDNLSYADGYFEMGHYEQSPTTWSIHVMFWADNQQGSAGYGDANTDAYFVGSGSGAVNGASNIGDGMTFNFTHFETGQYDITPNSFVLNCSYLRHQEAEADTSYDAEAGGANSTAGGITSGGAFGYLATAGDSYILDVGGNYLVTDTSFNVNGSALTYIGGSNDSLLFNDSGSYGGTQVQPASAGASATTTTSSGSYSDSQTDSDVVSVTITGGFTIDPSGVSDHGTNTISQTSSFSYGSGGADGQNQGSAQSSSDLWTSQGDDFAFFTASGNFADTPTSHSAGGSYTFNQTDHSSASQSNSYSQTSASSNNSYGDSSSSSSSFGYLDTGGYSLTDSGDDVSGHYTQGTINTSGEGWRQSGSASGSNSNSYTSNGNSTASSSYCETGDHTPTQTTGDFGDYNSASSTYSFSEKGASIDASSSNTYSDGQQNWAINTYSDSGSFSSGASDSRSASFSASNQGGDKASSSTSGNYNDGARKGSYSAYNYADTINTGSQWGNFVQSSASSRTTNFSQNTLTSSNAESQDGGKFLTSFGGSYKSTASSSNDKLETNQGQTITNPASTSTTGSFTTSNKSESNKDGSQTHFHGLFGIGGSSADTDNEYSSSTYGDTGTYTATGMAESRSASFSSSQVNRTKGSESDWWFYVGGSVGLHRENAHVATSSTASANGSYTSASGTYTEQGTASSGSLSRNDASQSNAYSTTTPSGAVAHRDMGSTTAVNSQSASGPYTKVNGAITKQQSSYTAGARTITQASKEDANNGQLNPSASQSVSTSNSASTLTSAFSSGNYSQTGGNTVDSGWQTQYSIANSSGLSSTNTSYNASVQGSLAKVNLTGSNKSEYFEIGTYTTTNGVNSTSSFVSQKTQEDSTELDDTSWSKSADPGTNYSSTVSATATNTTGSTGLRNVSAGQVTSASFNFKNTSTSHLQSSYAASQDVSVQGVPAAGAPAGTPLWGDWLSIPVLITPPDGAFTRGGSLPAIDSPTIGLEAQPRPTAFSSTALATTGFDSKRTENGTTTSISGTTSTSFSYSNSQSTTNTALQTISASFSYSFSGAGSSQITDSKSNSASASETDTSKGTYDNGVDNGTSKNSGAEQMIYSSNYVYDGSNTTSQGFTDTHSSTATANWQLTSFTTTGGFKNSPASGSAGASVSYNETTSIDSQLTNALGVTRTYNGSGPTASASSSGSYFVGAAGATHSNLSLTVDPTGGVDTRSGSYGGASTQSMNSSFTETGNATYVGMLEKRWNYQHTTSSQKNITDVGSYSTPQGDGIKSSQFSADGLETATYTITVWDDALNGWGPSYTWTDKFPNKVPLTVGIGFDGMSGNPPPDDPAAASSGWTEDDVLDVVQTVLDVAGFFPGVGEPFDVASGLISLYRDDYWGFVLSLGSMFPIVGWAGGAAKLAKRGAKFVISHVDEAAALGKAVISKTDNFGAALGKIGGRVDNAGGVLSKTDEAGSLLKGCFTAGALVAAAHGLKPIEDVRAGERVWAYDHVAGEWVLRTVLQTFRRQYEGHSTFVTAGGHTVESTLLHPFWVVSGEELDDRPRREHLPLTPERSSIPGRWVDAGDLRIGDRVLLRDGTPAAVEDVLTQPYSGIVYNLEIDDLHCYAVGRGGTLVHNNNGAEFVVNAANAKIAQVTANRIAGARAVDNFIAHAKANGMKVAGEQVTVWTQFGKRVYDVVLRNPANRRLIGVEIKSSMGAFKAFDSAMRRQFAADRWVKLFGAQVVGQNRHLGEIQDTIKILWRVVE